MKLEDVYRIVESLPWMTLEKAQVLYRFLTKVKPKRCLELGFFHGVSSCYIAAALHENGSGHLTTFDLESQRALAPNIYELLSKTGLETYVTPVYSEEGYNWELMKVIEAKYQLSRALRGRVN